MNNFLNSIIFSMLIVITPFIACYSENKESTYNKAIIWGIICIVICIFVSNFCTMLDINIVTAIITTAIATLINIGLIRKEINAKKFLKLIGVLCLFFLASLTQYIPILMFNLNNKNITNKEKTYLTLFSDIILLIILIIIYRKELKLQLKEFKNSLYSNLDTGFKCWLIGLIIMIISNLIILSLTGITANNENSTQKLIASAPAASLICMGIIAPFIEEITFRKSFYDTFTNKWVFIIVSGIFFGSMHIVFSATKLADYLYLIPYSALGIAFGYALSKTKNIFTTISIHMFHNTCLVLLSIAGNLAIIKVFL